MVFGKLLFWALKDALVAPLRMRLSSNLGNLKTATSHKKKENREQEKCLQFARSTHRARATYSDKPCCRDPHDIRRAPL